MTRAEHNLILMQDQQRWFDDLGVEPETLPLEARESGATTDVFYCSMKDIDIDFVGRLAQPLNLSALHSDDRLELNETCG